MKRKPSGAGGGAMSVVKDAALATVGLVAGQALGKMLADKVPQLADGKIRGAAVLGIGAVGAKMLPGSMRPLAVGLAASGGYQIAKELMPNAIQGIGELSPSEVELIEQMALESSPVRGLDESVRETVTGGMDSEVAQTVTGDGDDDEEGIGADDAESWD
ncbi:MAG: hypothetical protein N2483_02695 [Burkholderiaceae bacterium]|nr:hypothetical protein [Burkholderiaceae bacterium]